MLRSFGLLAMLVCLQALIAAQARAEIATVLVDYDTRSVAATFWYPDKLDVIRGVLVVTGGQGDGGSADTRAIADDAYWQRFAAQIGFGLMGNRFNGPYTDAANGPGQGLLDALSGLAEVTQHPELANAPLLMKGTSNGGYFSFTFTQFAPSRVIAFCLNKSGFATAPLDAPLLATPGLLIWGSEEPVTNTPTVIHALVQAGRGKHALWAEVKEWGVEHAEGSPERLFEPFFVEMVAARYPADKSPRDGAVPLIAVSEATGWLGEHADASVDSNLPVIAPFADYVGDKTGASWLPSAALAQLWRGFVTKTPITLSQPAAGAQVERDAPLQLMATGLGNGQQVRFLVGATQVASTLADNTGEASYAWTPTVNGIQAVVAIALNVDGVVSRISRPAQVLVYTKPAPDIGTGGAGPGAGGAGELGGSEAAAGSGGVGGSEADLDGGPDLGVAGGDPDAAGSGHAGAPGKPTTHRGTEVGPSVAGGGCSLVDVPARGSRVIAVGGALLLLSAQAVRRRRTRAAVRSSG